MKTALITGASHGIGKAIAHQLAKEGYQLALNCRQSKEEIHKLCAMLKKSYGILAIPCICDIGDVKAVDSMFAFIREKIGDPNCVINNAGISQIGLLSDLSADRWQEILSTNLSSVFYCCKQAIPAMVRNQYGKIINISSVWGEAGASCEVAYSASKGGVNAFTKALAKELAPSNIQVNAIACGCISTRMNACLNKEELEQLEEEIPSGRFGEPKEVAQLVSVLLSGHSYLTGQIIRLDGGWI